ncbi:MAG: hypothetical protein ACLPY5_12155 [Candidatus Bathyarchaeia archaeon]
MANKPVNPLNYASVKNRSKPEKQKLSNESQPIKKCGFEWENGADHKHACVLGPHASTAKHLCKSCSTFSA